MRILYCNKYNYPFSGTEVYLFELMELIRSEGHEVALFSMADPRGNPTPYDHHFVPHIEFKNHEVLLANVRRAAHAIYSREARRRIRAMIQEFRPDVAHVRNIYHHLSPSILWELKSRGVPVIYHLNDFKLLCPSYNLVSRGKVCEACKGGSFWHALRPRCYPGMGARITLTAEAYIHKWLGTYRDCRVENLGQRLDGCSRNLREIVHEIRLELEVDHARRVDHGVEPGNRHIHHVCATRSHLLESRADDARPFLIVRLHPEMRHEHAEPFAAERGTVERFHEFWRRASVENPCRRVGRIGADRRVETDREVRHRPRDRSADVLRV